MRRDVEPLPGFVEPYGLLCAVLQDATRDWRMELWVEELEPEEVTRRIRPGGQSIGAILLHMIGVELFWFEEFVLSKPPSDEDKNLLLWNEIDVDTGRWPEVPAKPLSWYFELQDRFRDRSLETIKSWPAPETLLDMTADRSYTPRWVLGHVVQHESYHGGQIVMLHDFFQHQNR